MKSKLRCNHNITNLSPALVSPRGAIYSPNDTKYISRVWDRCSLTLPKFSRPSYRSLDVHIQCLSVNVQKNGVL